MKRLAQVLELGNPGSKVFVVVCYECRDVLGDVLLSFEHAETRLFKHMSDVHGKKLKFKDSDGKTQTLESDS